MPGRYGHRTDLVDHLLVIPPRYVNGINSLRLQYFANFNGFLDTETIGFIICTAESHRNGKAITYPASYTFKYLDQQPHSILQRSAVYVVSFIGVRRQKIGNQVAMSTMNLY